MPADAASAAMTAPAWMPWLLMAAGYLFGSLSFAVIISRAMGLSDPRSYGSGNPGATNVLRSGNRTAALLTLAFDALKGYLPVLAVLIAGPGLGLGDRTAAVAAGVGLAAFVGHLWPVFFGFRGGKGVATAAGVLFAIQPWLGLATLASFAIVVAFLRFVSLGSIIAALFAPFYQALVWGGGWVLVAVTAMSVLLIARHAPNIRKLLAGTESRLGQKARPAEPAPSGPAGDPPRNP